MTKNRAKTTRRSRDAELRIMLEERRLELIGSLRDKIRDVRTESAAATDRGVRDAVESSEAEIQDDLEFALLQMKVETLEKINEALERLDAGRYGDCFECGEEIAHSRLQALPFAVRCKSCEEVREAAQGRAHPLPARRSVEALFADMIG